MTKPPKLTAPRKRFKQWKGLERVVNTEIREVLKTHPAVVLFERRKHTSRQIDSKTGRLRWVSIGIKGRCDWWAVLLRNGTHIEIEAKRKDKKGKLSPEQEEFRDECREKKIPWLECTSGKQLAKWLDTLI